MESPAPPERRESLEEPLRTCWWGLWTPSIKAEPQGQGCSSVVECTLPRWEALGLIWAPRVQLPTPRHSRFTVDKDFGRLGWNFELEY